VGGADEIHIGIAIGVEIFAEIGVDFGVNIFVFRCADVIITGGITAARIMIFFKFIKESVISTD